MVGKGNKTDSTSGAGTANPFRSAGFHPSLSLVFWVVLCSTLFVLLSFSVGPLCCPSFDIRLLITTLVSSNLLKHFILNI